VIVPVAGVAGVPGTVYVKVVAPVTVIVKVPLYSVGLAPAIVTLCPVVNPWALTVVTVAGLADRVMLETDCAASAVIVPVAGVAGVPATVYVKVVAPVTVIVKVPLYAV
jgi:hypothetical protein